ncbi:MAG: hypothetical protein ABW328_15195 [Ilumatobacteraceae bacterium]
MWTHRTQRFVAAPAADVRAGIADLVAATWARSLTVSTTDHNGTRTDWLYLPGTDELDVALSWTVVDLGDTTYLQLTLDEIEPGGDALEGMEAVLDHLESLPRLART